MPPDITTDPSARDPLALIRAAVKKAQAAGATVTTSPDLGVVCTSTEAPTWETEGQTPILSPLGAVLLVHQPRVPVADEALASALGVGPIWILGFDDGVTGGNPGACSVVRGPAVRLYGDGFRAGAEFRARFGVPRLRDADEITQPIPHLAGAQRHAKLVEFLGGIPLGETVRALIAGIPEREWTADDKADLLETLQELLGAYPGL